jgi:hypothetical protein
LEMVMPDRDPDIREAILHAIKVIRNWTIILFVALGAVTAAGIYEVAQRRAELQHVANQTIGALCTFRADLARRAEDGRLFLVEHPDGIPGIPPAVIRQNVENQLRTLDALSGLPCRGVPPEVP